MVSLTVCGCHSPKHFLRPQAGLHSINYNKACFGAGLHSCHCLKLPTFLCPSPSQAWQSNCSLQSHMPVSLQVPGSPGKPWAWGLCEIMWGMEWSFSSIKTGKKVYELSQMRVYVNRTLDGQWDLTPAGLGHLSGQWLEQCQSQLFWCH